jgi:hypothetical protein
MPPPSTPAARAIELQGAATGLLDEPLLLRARGAGSDGALVWRARLRDDEGRVWRAAAARPDELTAAWEPAKPTARPLAALQSLRPVSIDVRVEAPDGRGAARTFARSLVGEGVRIRRWRDGLPATLHLPAREAPTATLVIDATAGPPQAAVATLAAPLLASRGVLALVVTARRGRSSEAVEPAELDAAAQRLAAIPVAAPHGAIEVLPALAPFADAPTDGTAVVLPPGVAGRASISPDTTDDATARAAAWDALLARLHAEPRATGAPA